MEHDLWVDGHDLIEKKKKSLIDVNGKTFVFVHIRSIDEKSYKVTDIKNGVFGSESKSESGFWTNLWNSDIPPPKSRLRNFINNIIFISILILKYSFHFLWKSDIKIIAS